MGKFELELVLWGKESHVWLNCPQVTGVISKDSSLQEADLLLSVDGRSLRDRRPAQVSAQIDSTGPKGVLLTARGVKLPPSLIRPRGTLVLT